MEFGHIVSFGLGLLCSLILIVPMGDSRRRLEEENEALKKELGEWMKQGISSISKIGEWNRQLRELDEKREGARSENKIA